MLDDGNLSLSLW